VRHKDATVGLNKQRVSICFLNLSRPSGEGSSHCAATRACERKLTGIEPSLRTKWSLSRTRTSPPSVVPKDSLPCSKYPASGSYPEPGDEVSKTTSSGLITLQVNSASCVRGPPLWSSGQSFWLQIPEVPGSIPCAMIFYEK
jgi:hypothetical protein